MDEENAKWATWLQAELDQRGWKQADLVRASENRIKRDRVSKWLAAKELPSYRLAVVLANTLGHSQAIVLKAAGFDAEDDESGEGIASGRVRMLEKALDDIERQLPRDRVLARLSRYSESELLSELQLRQGSGNVVPIRQDDPAINEDEATRLGAVAKKDVIEIGYEDDGEQEN